MNRIREARKQAGIKQIDLCARLGISQGALSGWENGKYEPTRLVKEKIRLTCKQHNIEMEAKE